MAKIQMKTPNSATVEEIFSLFLSAETSKGVKQKTLKTYRSHLQSIKKRLDTQIPISQLTKKHLSSMITIMRKENLSANSIQSYTRTLKVFFSWCNVEGYSSININIYKAQDSVKPTYTDEELRILLEKPSSSCSFAEYRNWTIINFLLNSGCRASTIRNILIQDVNLSNRQITLRHTKNGQIQVIPLCHSMITILREYINIRSGKGTDYLFCNEFGNMLTEGGLRKAIIMYNHSRGIQLTSIHAFRHTFARKFLLDCGGNAFTLQKLMGHNTLKMTRHYCNIYNQELVDNYDRFSPLAQMTSRKNTTLQKRANKSGGANNEY